MGRANRIIALALGVIIVLAVVAAIVSGKQPTRAFDPSSPEAAVQRFVDAALHGRADEAARGLAPESECGFDDLIDVPAHMEPARVVLVDSSGSGSAATVQVELVYGSGGAFDPEPPRDRHTYRLIRTGGEWRLTGVPWPLFECRHPDVGT